MSRSEIAPTAAPDGPHAGGFMPIQMASRPLQDCWRRASTLDPAKVGNSAVLEETKIMNAKHRGFAVVAVLALAGYPTAGMTNDSGLAYGRAQAPAPLEGTWLVASQPIFCSGPDAGSAVPGVPPGTYADAVTFFPELQKVKTPDLKIFNTIHYKGDFTGFIHNFVSKGSIQTPLGIIKTDLNIKLPIGHQPEYSGDISTPDFRLGEFLKDPNLGAISFEGEVNGTGFSAGNRNVTLNGKFDVIDYNKYRYSGITVNGNLDKQLFNGKASINDPNAELTLDGKINLSPEPLHLTSPSMLKKLIFSRLAC